MPSEGLGDGDYEVALAVPAGDGGRTAEEWVRSVLEGAPAVIRWSLTLGWKAMRFPLGPAYSRRHVLRWPIVEDSPDRVLLGIRSPVLGASELVLRVEPEQVTLASFVTYRSPLSRALWTAVRLVHAPVLGYLLARASARSAAR